MTKYDFPSNIEAAAKLLDIIKPGWEKIIDLSDLYMDDEKKCIIGQLYGDYDYRNDLFFNYPNTSDDKVFSFNTPVVEWMREIDQRLKLKGHDFIWALEQINNNKKVKHKDFLDSYFFHEKGGYLKSDTGGIVAFEGLYNFSKLVGWEIYEEDFLVKRGDRVLYKKNNEEHIVSSLGNNKYGLISLNSGNIWSSRVDEINFLIRQPLSKLLNGDNIENWALVK